MTAQTREEILEAYWREVEEIEFLHQGATAPLDALRDAGLRAVRAERDRKLAELGEGA